MDKKTSIEKKREKPGYRKIRASEPEWLYDLRSNAWDRFHQSDLPLRSSHLWRYTDPKIFEEAFGNFTGDRQAISGDNGNGDGSVGGPSGMKDAELPSSLREKGVILKTLSSLVAKNDYGIREYLGSLIGYDSGRYESLNMALWDGGLFLFIPDNMAIDEPIYLGELSAIGQGTRRMLLNVGDNVQVTIIDDHPDRHSESEGTFNQATELFAGDRCNIKFIDLNRSIGTTGYINYRARIGANTDLHSIFCGFGSTVLKVNAGVILNGRGANSHMDGIVFADANQHFDYHTRHHHTAGDSFSNLDFKVILKDKATSAYTGLIRIEKDALNCEAYQENRNLLLNPGTRAESIPELEILTDEVRCTHGATMGPIDQEMIFYLQSRGLNKKEATTAIIEGFISPILKRIPEKTAGEIGEIVSKKLGENGNV